MKARRPISVIRTGPAGRVGLRPRPEPLEGRLLLATFSVNDTADTLTPPPGYLTLRLAIQEADVTPGPNTIDLNQNGIYEITLPGDPGQTDNKAGEFAVTDVGDLSIVNTSGSGVTIDGGGLNRVFDINPARSTTPFKVTFQGVTIRGGSDNDGGGGGGIRAQAGASVALINSTVVDNAAIGSGGGVEIGGNLSTGTLTLVGSSIERNSTIASGGGIEDLGPVLVSIGPGSSIADNTSQVNGGGVDLSGAGASLVATGATFSRNTAFGGGGGGIYGRATLDASLVEYNVASQTGGGLDSGGADLSLTETLFLDNHAGSYGGGVDFSGNTATISYGFFEGNVARRDGGGLDLRGGTATLTHTRVDANRAVNGGGIEDSGQSLNVGQSTIDQNTAVNTSQNGPDGYGGGIDIVIGSVRIQSSLLRENRAAGSGGAIAQLGGDLLIDDSQFTANAGYMAGAIEFLGTNLNVDSTTFNLNRTASFGGALLYYGTGSVANGPSYLSNDTFVANVAGPGTGGRGGAIDDGGSNLSLVSDTINNNTAATGGGIFNGSNSPISIENTIVALDVATTGPDVYGPFSDLGGDLVSTTAGSTGFGPGTRSSNPMLGPLQDNGGRTAGVPAGTQVVQTEAIRPGSPAFNAGVKNINVITDPRGFTVYGLGATTPTIGAYQPQYAANATPDQVFAENLYEVILNRTDPSGTAALAAALDSHFFSPTTAASYLANTPEHHMDEVVAAYQQFLHRAPDSASIQGAAQFLNSGATLEQLATILTGGAEYYQLHGSDNDTVAVALYQDFFNRNPEGEAQQALVAQAVGSSQSAIAGQLAASQEAALDLVLSDYQAILGRPADSTSVPVATAQLRSGRATNDSFLAFLLGSPESTLNRTGTILR